MLTRSLLLLLFVGAAWSVKPALVKLALTDGLSRQSVMFFMICGIGVVAALYLSVTRSWPRMTAGILVFIVASAVTAQLVPIFIATLVALHLPVSILALFVCTTPFFAAAMSACLNVEMPSLRLVGAIALALVSAVVVLAPQNALSSIQIAWAALLLVVPVSYAANQQIVFRFWPREIDVWQLAGVETVAASLMLLPYYFFTTGLSFETELSQGHIAVAFWIAVMLAETVAFFALVEREGPVFVSIGAIVAVMVAPLWGMALFAENITAAYGWSAASFAVALLLLLLEQRRSKREEPPEHGPSRGSGGKKPPAHDPNAVRMAISWGGRKARVARLAENRLLQNSCGRSGLV